MSDTTEVKQEIKQETNMDENGGGDERARKLFLGGLNYETTEAGLISHFEKFGKIVDVIVMKFPDSRRSR